MTSREAFSSPLEHPVRLSVFEGPLDLLLFLIRKNEIDIYDIPIERITNQYIGHLRDLEQMQLEVAGEFFVMAATLMHIKSRMLLPKREQVFEEGDEDEEIDPRWELVQQLIEYKKFKDASEDLAELMAEAADHLPRQIRTEAVPRSERPLKAGDRIELWNVFNQVLRRLADRITVGRIHEERISVADQMEFLLQKLKSDRSFTFYSLFDSGQQQFMTIVATFLALLELARLNQIVIAQDEQFSDILCSRGDSQELE